MNLKKVISVFLIIFGAFMLFMGILFGVIFGVTGGAMGKAGEQSAEEWEAFKDDAVATTGEIISTGNGTTIKYYAEEADAYYEATLSVTTSQYPVGKEVTVYYNEDNPADCMVPEIMESTYGIMNTVFSGMGLVMGILFGGIGLVILVVGIILGKKKKA